MIQLLSRWLIHDRDNVSSPAVRRAYGTLCGAVGIALNILLFAGKFFAGQLSGSIAVTADAFNNLSDAGSSAVTLLGFRLAGKKPDTDHPFGHGRIEYISGLIVAGLILLMGVELAKSSLDKILHPEEVTFSLLALGIMAASVCVKLYMWLYNRQVGRRIHSAAMEATAMDSLSDTASTFAVLVAMLIGKWTGLAVDGYVGLVVALFILFSAYKAARETLSPLLGQAPDPELVREIRDIVLSDDTVVGVHDLVVHDYGPGRLMITPCGGARPRGHHGHARCDRQHRKGVDGEAPLSRGHPHGSRGHGRRVHRPPAGAGGGAGEAGGAVPDHPRLPGGAGHHPR